MKYCMCSIGISQITCPKVFSLCSKNIAKFPRQPKDCKKSRSNLKTVKHWHRVSDSGVFSSVLDSAESLCNVPNKTLNLRMKTEPRKIGATLCVWYLCQKYINKLIIYYDFLTFDDFQVNLGGLIITLLIFSY